MTEYKLIGLRKLSGFLALLLAIGWSTPAATAAPNATNSEVARRLADSATVFQEIMSAPDKGIPQDLLDRSQCVAIVPRVKKGAFIFGAQYGRGFISCRNKNGIGWTGPAAVTVQGGSFGLQIGGEETDVVLLLMNKDAENRLLSSQFTVGADASVAAGPVGRSASADTDAYMSAELLSWSRSHGVFAGVALRGATLRQDLETNQLVYGKELSNKQIIEGDVTAPKDALPLAAVLDRYSERPMAGALQAKQSTSSTSHK